FKHFKKLLEEEIRRIRKAISEDPETAKNLIRKSLILREEEKERLLKEARDEQQLLYLKEIVTQLKRENKDEDIAASLQNMETKLDEHTEKLDEIDQKMAQGTKWTHFANLVGLLSFVITLAPYIDQAKDILKDTLVMLIDAIIEA